MAQRDGQGVGRGCRPGAEERRDLRQVRRLRGREHEPLRQGEGRDGQQLLEELRYRELIGLKTVFVMVTAESVYEKVVSTAELAPDDYLLKPFSAEVMRNRLEISLRRKQAFEAAFHCHEEGDLGGAIAACDLLLREKPKYLVDALRFKGESDPRPLPAPRR